MRMIPTSHNLLLGTVADGKLSPSPNVFVKHNASQANRYVQGMSCVVPAKMSLDSAHGIVFRVRIYCLRIWR